MVPCAKDFPFAVAKVQLILELATLFLLFFARRSDFSLFFCFESLFGGSNACFWMLFFLSDETAIATGYAMSAWIFLTAHGLERAYQVVYGGKCSQQDDNDDEDFLHILPTFYTLSYL